MKEIIYFCSVQLEMQDAIFLAFENRLSTHTLNCWKQREKIAYYIWPGSDLLQIGPLKSDRNWTITQAAAAAQKQLWDFLQIWDKILYEVVFSINFLSKFSNNSIKSKIVNQWNNVRMSMRFHNIFRPIVSFENDCEVKLTWKIRRKKL